MLMKSPGRALILVGAAALLLGVAVASLVQYMNAPSDASSQPGLLWPPPRTLGDFSLIDDEQQPFTPASLHGRWSLLFFGFTHCPDICPNTLRILEQARPELPADSQVVFVSVDPERDTPDKMASYVNHFDPRFIGVTGTTAAIDSFARQLGIAHMRAAGDSSDNYTVDHTASIFLIDPARRMVGMFSQPLTAQSLVNNYRGVREFVEDQQ